MFEPVQIKIGGKLTVDPRQQVQVESCGDTLAIIIGAQDRFGIFLEVKPDQCHIPGAEVPSQIPAKVQTVVPFHIPDIGSQKRTTFRLSEPAQARGNISKYSPINPFTSKCGNSNFRESRRNPRTEPEISMGIYLNPTLISDRCWSRYFDLNPSPTPSSIRSKGVFPA